MTKKQNKGKKKEKKEDHDQYGFPSMDLQPFGIDGKKMKGSFGDPFRF
jgi:hypothetical protein